jgi:GT2 family glycosyltransferase
MVQRRDGSPAGVLDQADATGSQSRAAEPRARLVVIVVFFRTPELLASCLETLRRQTLQPDEILVVDNSSAVDGVGVRPAAGHDWRWVRADRNLGFGAACNLGARLTRSDYILFVNADVIVDRSTCKLLSGSLDADGRVGVVGPRIYGADGQIELSARSFPSIATGIVGRSSSLTRVLRAAGRAPADVAPSLGSGGLVDWVSGACMLVRRDAFEKIGGFDEGFWMYWEDADLCRRLAREGSVTILCTAAEARHSTGASGRDEQTIIAFHTSAARYYELHCAKTSAGRALARAVLRARMRLVLRRYARRRSV